MKVLITGGTGFIGQHVVQLMLDEGHEPVTLSRHEPLKPLCQNIVSDASSPAARSIISEFDAVIHLAGLADASSSFDRPYLYNKVNALSTLNMLEGCREAKIRFLLASSQRVYQPSPSPIPEGSQLNPVDPYGVSKMVAEQWAHMYHEHFSVPTVVLRFFSVYGPGLLVRSGTSGVASIFLQRALKSKPLEIYGRQLRDFTFVDDVASGILRAAMTPSAAGRTYNIATGTGVSLKDLAVTVRDVTGSSSEIVLKSSDSEGLNYVADVSRAERELDFKAKVQLREGISRYAEWVRTCSEPSSQMPPD